MGSEHFWKVLKGFETFSDLLGEFWGILRLSDRLWAVSKGFWRFWWFFDRSVQLHPKAFLRVLRGSERFLKNVLPSLTLWGCFEGHFSWLLTGSERFLKVLIHFLTFWGVFWRCEVFWGVQMHSDSFSWVPSCSEGFFNVLRHFLRFSSFLTRFNAFSWVLSCSEMFLNVMMCSLML